MIGFDGCLMSNWEAANALQSLASYLLVSEKLEPADGWDYRSLAQLVKTPKVGAFSQQCPGAAGGFEGSVCLLVTCSAACMCAMLSQEAPVWG